MTNYLIKGAQAYGGDAADILFKNGRIAAIGDSLSADGAEVVDATGLIALPGLVDLHTHLREPGREDAETVETGSQSAALGGFTAVHAMANTDPVADTAGVVEQVWRLGREAGYVDVRPVGAVTVGLGGERLAELGAMADSAAGVRVFSDDGHCVSDAVLMRRALEYVKAFDGVVAQHAQEPRLTEGAQMNEGELSGRLGLRGWPAVAEEAIIARDVLLAAHVGSRLHICHVATDHAPHPVEDKECEWDAAAFGMLGLETALSVVQATMVDRGLMDWAAVADRLCVAPARIGRCDSGEYAQGRPLAVGEPANLVLLDPAAERTVEARELSSLSRNSPYDGMTLPGQVVATFLRGRPTVLDGK